MAAIQVWTGRTVSVVPRILQTSAFQEQVSSRLTSFLSGFFADFPETAVFRALSMI